MNAVRRYKPVDRKVRPVLSYMPDPQGQILKHVIIPDLPPLPFSVPTLCEFTPTEHVSRERLDLMLSMISEDFLLPLEIDLLVFVIRNRERSIAFNDAERGTFSREYFPDYEIRVIEHTPWVQAPIRIPKAIEGTVHDMLIEQKNAGKYEYLTASYHSRIITVAKKNGIRIVHDVQELNKVTIRDAALPPRVDDFAEGHVGHVIYGLADLFSGYDNRVLAVSSRPLTTFSSPVGPLRLTVLPQGATNSVPEFQRCAVHTLDEDLPKNSDTFMDDITVKGPRSDYGQEEIRPGIRRFVYEYLTTLDRILVRFIMAGITVSGPKFILATPRLGIVGSVVSKEGWHLSHGLVNKILKWPEPTNVSEVRGFLGTAGVGRKWIKHFSLIGKPLTFLTRGTEREFYFDNEAREAFNKLKALVGSAPVLVRLDYEIAKLITMPPRESDHGLIIVAVDSCTNGAGWVMYQQLQKEKHPTLFGSCTFSEVESRYSQPKCELYGVFRALKDLQHRIWGVHFRLEVDAKFLKEMIKSPDLPNAPMTRWVTYLSLFDFEICHVPAEKHKAPDGLSRRRRAPEDSGEEDANEYLDKIMGSAKAISPSSPSHSSFDENFLSHPNTPDCLTDSVEILRISMRCTPVTPFGEYETSTVMATISILELDEEDDQHDAEIASIRKYRGFDFDPAWWNYDKTEGTLLTFSLLKSTDSTTYTGHEFEHCHVPTRKWVEIALGNETFNVEVVSYGYEYMTGLRTGESHPQDHDLTMLHYRSYSAQHPTARMGYEDVALKDESDIATISHVHGRKEGEQLGYWDDMLSYLKDNVSPFFATASEQRAFLKRSNNFIVHDG